MQNTKHVNSISVAGNGMQIGPKQICSCPLASLHTLWSWNKPRSQHAVLHEHIFSIVLVSCHAQACGCLMTSDASERKEKKRKDYAFRHEFNEKSNASAGQKAERGGACQLQKAAKGTGGHQVEPDS